jgi:hypothetical protein
MGDTATQMNCAAAPSNQQPGDYIVYAAPKNEFKGWRIENREQGEAGYVHSAIARHEGNRTDVDYMGLVRPGSFNVTRVAAKDLHDAIQIAVVHGLKYEAPDEVWRRETKAAQVKKRERAIDINEFLGFRELIVLSRAAGIISSEESLRMQP